jgi:hypothetical protein
MGFQHVTNVLSVTQIESGIDLIKNIHRGRLEKEEREDQGKRQK